MINKTNVNGQWRYSGVPDGMRPAAQADFIKDRQVITGKPFLRFCGEIINGVRNGDYVLEYSTDNVLRKFAYWFQEKQIFVNE